MYLLLRFQIFLLVTYIHPTEKASATGQTCLKSLPESVSRKPHRFIMVREPSALNKRSIMRPLTWMGKAISSHCLVCLMRHLEMLCLLVTARSLRFNSDWEGRISLWHHFLATVLCFPSKILSLFVSQTTYLANKHWWIVLKRAKVAWFPRQSASYKCQEKKAVEAVCLGPPLMKRLLWRFNLD